MKSIFDQPTREALIARIKTLDESSKANWGSMNVYQMLKHCTVVEEMYLGKTKYKRMFLGRILGKMALKKMTKDESPMQQNAPTADYFKIQEISGDLSAEREKWIGLIEEYGHYSNPEFIHWFFGKMTKEQIGLLAYKHTDHHLRQFNS